MTRDEILELFPEINEIANSELRERTIVTWESALERGGMTVADLKRMPCSLLVENPAVTFAEHVRTTCQLCIACWDVLQKAYGNRNIVHRDNLIAGALLADVGKVLEIGKKGDGFGKSEHAKYLRHPFSGVGLCWEQNLPDPVMHIVAMHSKEAAGFPRTPEGIVFHHCDFIDFELVGGSQKQASGG